jgi:uncharacterized protein (TIGR01244 family)
MFKTLDSKVLVAGQISPEDVALAVSRGVTTIVNNRPDGEEPGQPESASIEAAARDSGLDYRDIPVAGGISPGQIEAAAEVMDSASGRVLMFCRSGTRSTYLWALARARKGADGEALIAAAAEAGYDLTPLRPRLCG